MRPMRAGARATTAFLLLALLATACGTEAPSPTPYPSGAPAASPDDAVRVAQQFVSAWADGDYRDMWRLVAPADRAARSRKEFTDLYASFHDLVGLTDLTATAGQPLPIALPPQPRPPDLPAPTATPAPSGSASRQPRRRLRPRRRSCPGRLPASASRSTCR